MTFNIRKFGFRLFFQERFALDTALIALAFLVSALGKLSMQDEYSEPSFPLLLTHRRRSSFAGFVLVLLLTSFHLISLFANANNISYLHRKLPNLFMELKHIVEGFHGIFNSTR